MEKDRSEKEKAVLFGPRDLRLVKFVLDTKNIGPGCIWVKTEVSALSTGTDRGNFEGAEQVPGAPSYPRWVGYSNVGIVRAIGRGVTRFRPGDRVFAPKPHMSDYIAHETEGVVKVPQSVEAQEAVFTKHYHLGFLSLRHVGALLGQNIAVVGLGVLGLCTVEIAASLGARVIALGNDDFRLAKAKEVGAQLSLRSDAPDRKKEIDDFTNGEGVDLVVLTANPWPAYEVGMDTLKKSGTMAILSLPGRGEADLNFNPLSLKWFYAKSPSIVAAHRFNPAVNEAQKDFDYMLFLMAERKLRPDRLITHRLPYQRMIEAYEMAYRREKTMIGSVFVWG